MSKKPMISKRTAVYFAQEAHWLATRYGKYQGKLMRGLCFYNVDFDHDCVDLGFSTETMLYIFSIPIRKSWNM